MGLWTDSPAVRWLAIAVVAVIAWAVIFLPLYVLERLG